MCLGTHEVQAPREEDLDQQLFQQIRLIWRSQDYVIKLVESMSGLPFPVRNSSGNVIRLCRFM